MSEPQTEQKTYVLKNNEPPPAVQVAIPKDDEFKADFLFDPRLQSAGEKLIERKRPELKQFRIAFLWKRKGGQSKGKATLGKCQLATGLVGHFSDRDAVITLSADNLRLFRPTSKQFEAVLFHELLHLALSEDEEGNDGLVLMPHDYEGFVNELAEYGLWKIDLTRMAEGVKQLNLFNVDQEKVH